MHMPRHPKCCTDNCLFDDNANNFFHQGLDARDGENKSSQYYEYPKKDVSITQQNLNTMNPKVCNKCRFAIWRVMCLIKDDALDLMVHNLMHWISIPTLVEILPGAEIIANDDNHEVVDTMKQQVLSITASDLHLWFVSLLRIYAHVLFQNHCLITLHLLNGLTLIMLTVMISL